MYEDQAIGVADRIRRREARLPARAAAKAPGAEAAAQTEEEEPPQDPGKPDEPPMPQAFMGLDLDWLTEEVGAAVTWGASSSDAPL